MASNRDSEHWHPAAEQKHAEPASSFFAVHLAPHIASQGSQAHHLTRETFSQLRQELLGGRYRQLRLDDSVTDVNKLVCVVLKAGLEPNWKEDGLNRKDFKSQITDCLDIIQAAVEKAPQCLTEFADPEILGKGIRAPLFAWLVLRLIDLFNAWNCEDQVRDAHTGPTLGLRNDIFVPNSETDIHANKNDSLMTIQDVLESSSHPNLQRLQVKRNNRSFSKMNISGSSVEIQRLSVTCEATDPKDETRAAKRLCLSRDLIKHEDWNPLQQLLTRSFILLRSESSKGIQDLGAAVSDSFAGLSEEDKCKILETLGRISCAIAGGLSRRPSGITTDAEMLCNVCDNEDYENNAPSNMQRSSYDSLREALTVILSQLTRASSPRVAAMVALRRLLMHDSTSNQMQLASSVFGEFCLNSLRSSIRELRLVTGHSVAAFVRTGTGSETRRSNFVIVLEWLKNLSEKNEISLQETCILTLCRLACFSGDEEMNIILLRLLEYLGHSNPFICAVTHTELSKLAQDLSVTPTGLFRPFWRTISITVVKNFQSRPYMAEQLCDLLGMKVDDFLRLTEVHILPYLVLTRKRDLICKVAATYKNTKSPFDICSEKNNLAAILAFLLSQPSSDPEGMIMTLLAEVDPSFKGRTLAELVRTEPILIACDLLKGLGDSGDVKGERYHRALRVLAALVPRKCTSRNAASKRSSSLGHFIEEHVLGIITQFANAVNDFQVRQSLVEKKRNIVAIGEMIKIAGGHVGSALPQICACLRSALDIEHLCDYAFRTWGFLISSLSEEEIEPLIDQTFSIIIKYWRHFTSESREFAYKLAKDIFKDHGRLVQEIFNTMPSLVSVPALAEFEAVLSELKGHMDVRSHFQAFIRRCQNENAIVVEQALTELEPYLSEHEDFLHSCVLSEQPDPVVAHLTRSLLDCCVKFNTSSGAITLLSTRCLGLIGCLDPNRVDSVKEKMGILVLSNFERMDETLGFVLFFLQHVLVDAFLSASNTRAQGFLAYAMQALLKICRLDSTVTLRPHDIQVDERYHRWLELPETVRNTLTPFLTSKYTVTVGAIGPGCEYPLFRANLTYGDWLRTFVQDLLQRGVGSNENVQLVFSACSRIVKGQDISIASFLLPFAVLNCTIGGSEKERRDVKEELTNILSYPLPDGSSQIRESIILCSQSVFEVLDYLSRWLQGKKKQLNNLVAHSSHTGRVHKEAPGDFLIETYGSQIKSVEALLSSIPPEVISRRAVECKSFSRALFHWEQYIRLFKNGPGEKDSTKLESLYRRLQDIYSQIDEPDGIEGISTHLQVLNIDQQVLEHRRAGRWATAQSWYELQLEKEPSNTDAQWNLLTCLKESGQQDAIVTRFEALKEAGSAVSRLLPFTVEASWIMGKWDKLDSYIRLCMDNNADDFNIGIGQALNALRRGDRAVFNDVINGLRLGVAKSLTVNSVSSLQSCHVSMLKLHALTEVELIADTENRSDTTHSDVCRTLDRRLDILGGYLADKQYLLGLRRASMELSGFDNSDIAAAWLTSARLSRKGNFTSQAYHSMLHATQLKDRSATIEHARLLWKDGHHRKAIQILEGAIAANEFMPSAPSLTDGTSTSLASNQEQHHNMLAARAHLLLAKWTDRAGQTQSDVIVQRYREAIRLYTRWEKAHYYLGKHYNKILDSEKAKPLGKEAQIYLSGEASKLVIDNYLRSLAHGNKYVFQTLPKILTLWLAHASTVDQPFDPKRGDNTEFQKHSISQRKKSLDDMHLQLKKYLNRMPAALLFTILPQVVARLGHSNSAVYDLLTKIVAKAVNAFPQQGLWTVIAVVKSSSKDRSSRGINCLRKITETTKRLNAEFSVADMRAMINQGQKFSEEMLKLCVARVEDKVSRISLARSLGFNHRVAPCRLVVPFQAMLTPSLPASHDSEYLKSFRAFPRDPTIIEGVLDNAQVLNSLQKPRKVSLRGSDGKIYNILCKPKDDLRVDQRLMEFNNMINRFLKRDVESSKRRMYIKTYAVTPLNEECGIIEWVDNLRTLRELVVKLLRERGIMPNYNEIRHYLNEACSDMSKLSLFTTKILAKFPPVLHEWFIEMFPDTGAWFAARLRYTRSCAVMSMVGYVLGLGDRHGENILFEEGTGGILHVDFNCLFDKGLTFDKPELVPFRLTHNMVDAFGAYGYNGPFRRTCEISLNLLRLNEDALMTILETFLHDPTTDFIGKKRRAHPNVPDTPSGVLESVRNKLRGLLPGESVPLSVDGHVDELIMQATDTRNLAAMYIGWCAYF
ncbi:serine/threonine-protein kinase M1 [Monascus purpureus]|uniref:Serine/threonine-protein kinase MEC1 n=1 Tax=Monascus purpureus TaxID=5098 RepID=A0A507QL04_MONPU|nr:serine/threonine-protein kinase M1 [Monascus purpureus]